MINKEYFGKTHDGTDVFLYCFDTGKIRVKVCEFGACLISVFTPDRQGNMRDVICGYDSLDSYENGDGYQGAVVGRCANRIDRGHFILNGKEYHLNINNGDNHLHGGQVGFSHRVWSSEIISEDCVRFSYFSPDGEENYPGNLTVSVDYKIYDNKISITYRARSDKDTVVNLTNHAYFNLGGYDSGDIFGHRLKILANKYLPTNERLIPTGGIKDVFGTPFDFTSEKTIGRDFDLSEHDLNIAGGYDHCLVFENVGLDTPQITVVHQECGRKMRVYTTQPCVQLYSGNFLNNENYPFKGGYPQGLQNAFCLETQIMPDSINHDNFTNAVLAAGEEYFSQTIFEFGA